MRPKLTEAQKSAILLRRANSSREVAAAKSRDWSGRSRFAGGLVMGVPLGVSLYYVAVYLYYPVIYLLCLCLWVTPRSPHSVVDAILYQVYFGPACVALLSILCVTLDVYCTRREIAQGRRAFAQAQAPLSIITVLALFVLTAIKHKPLLPFVGQ